MASDRPSRDDTDDAGEPTTVTAGMVLNDARTSWHSASGAVARGPDDENAAEDQAARDLADVPAVEVITATAVHLMSAAAVKVGLAQDVEPDLDEARKLITVLAALVTAAAPEIGNQHARPLRDGLRSLQLAFREASVVPDAPGQGPGEKHTGVVS